MNLIEWNRALGQLRLGGIAAVLETRLRQAQAEAMPPIDFLLPRLRRTHSSRRAIAGAKKKTSRVPRPSEDPR
jgi:hypothetical protein